MSWLTRVQALRLLRPQVTARLISTSQKKNEDVNTPVADAGITKTKAKNWVSYGFDEVKEEDDLRGMHSVFFTSVTLCLVVGGYVFMYAPDFSFHDWAQREAFLELKRREDAGLPLIDPNLIDPARVKLPSDEELGDTEIII